MISALSDEFDIRAIAAAALQMAFDHYPAITTQLEDELQSSRPIKVNKVIKVDRPQQVSTSSAR
jgi:hypothetical protein